MQLLATLAALSAAIASAHAQGSAFVYNHCSENVYLWAVDTERNPSSPTTIAPGSSWSEVYHTPASGGVSLKLSKTSSNAAVTQFEYTLTSGAYPFIWYDGSNINCQTSSCPFYGDNVLLGASISSCPERFCAATDTTCTGFYNQPDDNTATLSCDPSANVFMHLCYNNGTSSGAAPSSSPAASSPSPSKAASAPASSSHSAYIFEAPVATTFLTVTAPLAVRTADPLAAHAHARRHMHQRNV